MIRTFVLADFVTLGNGFAGAGTILSSMQYLATSELGWLWLAFGLMPLALVLDFAVGGQPLDTTLVPGSALEGEVVFWPGGWPLRALVKERRECPAPLPDLAGHAGFAWGGSQPAFAAGR